jgi:hypothetical protein
LAPIFSNGSITRFIGLERNESSPVMTELKGCPARTPANMRMVEPLLPQSSGAAGIRKPSSPTPSMMTVAPSR